MKWTRLTLRIASLFVSDILVLIVGAVFSPTLFAGADLPATRPAFDYKPGVVRVMTKLRDESTCDSAEASIREFPEDALPIARQELDGEFKDLPADVKQTVVALLDRNHAARAHFAEMQAADRHWNENSVTEIYKKFGHH